MPDPIDCERLQVLEENLNHVKAHTHRSLKPDMSMCMVVWRNHVQLLLGGNSILAAINSCCLRWERLQRFDRFNVACCRSEESEVVLR